MWAPWAGVSEITQWLSISQWFTSPSISVGVNGAHHMLTTLPFSFSHTHEDDTSAQHPQLWCEWHGCCDCCVEQLVDVVPCCVGEWDGASSLVKQVSTHSNRWPEQNWVVVSMVVWIVWWVCGCALSHALSHQTTNGCEWCMPVCVLRPNHHQ